MARARDAGTKTRLARYNLQAIDIRLFDLGEALGRNRLGVDVLHDARQVADLAFGIDDAGLFAAGGAIADELHSVLPLSVFLRWISRAGLCGGGKGEARWLLRIAAMNCALAALHAFPSRLSNSPATFSFVRMPGRRTDYRFRTGHAYPVRERLSRRSFPPSLFAVAPKRGSGCWLPQERERSAVRRNLLLTCSLAREHVPILARPARPTALHRGVLRRWDPSASPTCHGYCPMALGRRRDGRFHPRLLSEPGGLLHASPGAWLARPCARAPLPIHAQIALQSAPQRMGIRPPY